MLKISISASRALLGLGVITALAANATEVTPDNFQQNFEEKDGVWINKNQSGDFVLSEEKLTGDYQKDNILNDKKIVITTDGKVDLSSFYQNNGSLEITAKGGVVSNRDNRGGKDAFMDIYSPLKINGDLTMKQSSVMGDYEVTNVPLIVTGKVNATQSVFVATFSDANSIPLNVNFISGASGFNEDIVNSNWAVGSLERSAKDFIDNTLSLTNSSSYLSQNKFIYKYLFGDGDEQSEDFESVESVQDLADEFEKNGKIDFDKYKEDLLVLYTLKVNGDKLGAEGRLQVNARTLLYAKLQMIKSMKDNLEETKEQIEAYDPNTFKDELEDANKKLDEAKKELEELEAKP